MASPTDGETLVAVANPRDGESTRDAGETPRDGGYPTGDATLQAVASPTDG